MMKQIVYTLFLSLLMVFMPNAIQAQNAAPQSNTSSTIFDALNDYSFGKGEVIINQSDAISRLIGKRKQGTDVETVGEETFLKIQGFRAQVFSGNDQRRAKDEAFNKETEIKEAFPFVATYVTYSAPFWRLRVGDYRTHEEAYHMVLELKKAFPTYAKEMYIVREEIHIPLQ